MSIRTHYFYGNKVSEYGQEHGYVDYGTLSKAFDAVICNDITNLFYTQINDEWSEAEQVNGYIDNSDEIDAKREQIDVLTETRDNSDDDAQIEYINEQIDELNEQIGELEREQDEQPEIFQYYIISDSGAEILKAHTNEIVYYIPVLDVYVWGVTHCGTSWDYVLTDIQIEEDGEQ